MNRHNQAVTLLALATRDIKAARILANADEPQFEAAGFHLQQAAEKALKAWLARYKKAYPRTHDLRLLLGLLEDIEQPIDPFWDLLELNPFAVQFRYELPGEDYPEIDQTLQKVAKLVKHVQSLVEG